MKDVVRYSESFKRQVIREIEDGMHTSYRSASIAYNIRGCNTVQSWVEQYGKNHL